MVSALAVKAEVVVGTLLVVRHRTVRLAGALALVALVIGRGQARTSLVVAGSLAAVAASRVLAPGAALAAARRTAAPPWIGPAGRLLSVWLVVLAVILVSVATVGPGAGPGPGARVGLVAAVYAGALASVTAALAPLVGASVAASLGLLGAWFGAIPPSGVSVVLAPWPFLQRPLVALWNVWPLDWRAHRWLAAGTTEDLFVFLAWIVAGTVLGAWCVARYQLGVSQGAPA